MYATYTTNALVCGTYRKNTADATYALFTADSGMIYATARSVREERSRQRYALQDFSLVRISLVRGKSGWRIGSVESLQNFYRHAPDQSTRRAVVYIIKLLRRFVPSEGALPEVFLVTQMVFDRLIAQPADAGWLQLRYELWLLTTLGYVSTSAAVSLDSLCPRDVSCWQSCDTATELTITKLISTAVAASQL